ncbi:hypothetical protein HYV50_02540 [Candidatus Pacearchaeota archaeon]|nr:hypothetical protein [Candidatus Pacearchaeota archaeon]
MNKKINAVFIGLILAEVIILGFIYTFQDSSWFNYYFDRTWGNCQLRTFFDPFGWDNCKGDACPLICYHSLSSSFYIIADLLILTSIAYLVIMIYSFVRRRK